MIKGVMDGEGVAVVGRDGDRIEGEGRDGGRRTS